MDAIATTNVGGVLTIGMEHNDHAGAKFEDLLIPGPLIASIAAVLRVAANPIFLAISNRGHG